MTKIGLLIPVTNLTIEYEIQNLLRSNSINNVVFYINRIPYRTTYKENKEQFLKELAENSKLKLSELEYLDFLINLYSWIFTLDSIRLGNL